MALDTFLFDLDGTLVDSVADLATAINLLRAELNLKPIVQETVRRYVGDGARMLVQRALPADLYRDAHLERFLFLYRAHLLDQTRPYPGILDFLDSCEPARMAVVTNKPYLLTMELLSGLNLTSYFGAIIGGDSCRTKKPDPLPVQTALRQLKAHPRRAVMIGDHHTDLHAGQAAGLATCFCTWGMGNDGGVPSTFRAYSPFDLVRIFPEVAS
ncbi:MAG: HAD family hydrolase [Geoalkalibacter sp.]|uniref:HAD family hydrolase n=1 Tax=Geoalkalibacter sp. TaxID=3041440 RepID=UPI003D0DCF9B